MYFKLRESLYPFQGRKRHIWVSVSADLFFGKMFFSSSLFPQITDIFHTHKHSDARRDLDELGASFIKLKNISDCSYNKIDSGGDSFSEGVLFSTYSSLIAEKKSKTDGKVQTRIDQVTHTQMQITSRHPITSIISLVSLHSGEKITKWFGRGGEGTKNYDGVCILDEAHKVLNT